MKLVVRNKWFFFLPFLFTPVTGEMAINAVGLPTPWPIVLISLIIAFIGFKKTERLKSERKLESLNWLIWVVTIFSFFRCLVSLIGSVNSLILNGIDGFQYPELACLIPFTVSASIWQLKRGQSYRIEDIEMNRGEILLQGRSEIEAIVDSAVEGERTQRKIKFLKKLNNYLTKIVILWTMFSLGVYSSRRNFVASACFVTVCGKVPTSFSWHTLVQCTPQNSEFRCLIGSKDLWIIDLFVRSFIIFPLSFLVICNDFKEGEDEGTMIGTSLGIKGANWFLVTLIFSSVIMIQGIVGINVEGLISVCEINKDLVISYTGYLQEWWQQELTTLKQVSLV